MGPADHTPGSPDEGKTRIGTLIARCRQKLRELQALLGQLAQACPGDGGLRSATNGASAVGQRNLSPRMPEQAACLPKKHLRKAADAVPAMVPLMTAAHSVILHLAGKRGTQCDADILAAADRYGRLLSVAPDRLASLVLHIIKFFAGHSLSESLVPLPEPYVFRKQGQMWVVTFDSATTYLKDALGPAYVARLLAVPHKQISAPNLAASVSGNVVRTGSAGPQADAETLDEVTQRYLETKEELEEAKRNGDQAAADRAQGETNQLARYLAQVKGLSGRARIASDDADRIRRSVAQAIRRTIGALYDALPVAARHLDNSITTGRFCSYEPEEDLPWVL